MIKVLQPGGESPAPGPLQRFYQRRAFDTVFGVIPAVLLGVYSLYVIGITAYSSVREPGGSILLVFILGPSTLGLIGCIALLVSIFASVRLSKTWQKICGGLLSTALVITLILVYILIATGLNPGSAELWMFVIAALGLLISASAFKQIRLLSSGGDFELLP